MPVVVQQRSRGAACTSLLVSSSSPQPQQRPQARRRLSAARRLAVTAVLEKEPPAASPSRPSQPQQLSPYQRDAAALERLLPPSLSTSSSSRSVPARVLTCPETEVLYFAYGANLSLSTLQRRDVSPVSRMPSVVLDPTVKLVFKHRGGYSTLQQLQPGEQPKYSPYLGQVHGVLYQFGKEDLRKLAKREGGYQLVDIEVETYDGWRATAKTFVSGPLAQLHAEVVPTERYMKQLRDGAADQWLDPLYQAWLSSIETVPSVGLGSEYFDTPAKYVAYCFLGIVGLLVAGFFSQH